MNNIEYTSQQNKETSMNRNYERVDCLFLEFQQDDLLSEKCVSRRVLGSKLFFVVRVGFRDFHTGNFNDILGIFTEIISKNTADS